MNDESPSHHSHSFLRHTSARLLALLLAVGLVVAFLSSPVAAATDAGQAPPVGASQEKAPCPYDNPSQGAANAADRGLSRSLFGIQTAADQICS